MSHAYSPRINTGGNFCGHNPAKPNFGLPILSGPHGKPRILSILAERIEAYYSRPERTIPALNLANRSSRRQRSERREACIRVLTTLLDRLDLTSLRVGIPTPNGFMSFTFDYLAKESGLNIKRLERAVRDLKESGILTVGQARQRQPDGTWKGLSAIKAISKDLFGIFGLREMLKYEQKKAVARLKERIEKENRKSSRRRTLTEYSRIGLVLNKVEKKIRKRTQKNVRTTRENYSPFDAFTRREIMRRTNEISAINPHKTLAECREQAMKEIVLLHG